MSLTRFASSKWDQGTKGGSTPVYSQLRVAGGDDSLSKCPTYLVPQVIRHQTLTLEKKSGSKIKHPFENFR